MTPVVTAVFLVAMTVILIAIDVVLWRDSTDGNTYSEVIRNTWRKHRWFGMIIIFSFGLLAGHWFW